MVGAPEGGVGWGEGYVRNWFSRLVSIIGGEGVEGRCIALYSALQRGRPPPPPAEAVMYVITASLNSGVRRVKKKERGGNLLD